MFCIKMRFFPFVITLLMLFCCNCAFMDDRLIITDDLRKSYTADELKDVFELYQDDFLEVAEIVLNSESFGKTVGAGANDIWTTDSMIFFTEEEWSKIVNLFSDTGLAKIERSRKIGKDFVRFIYLWDGVRAVLYYCQTENESDLSNYALDYSVWERIREYWWIGYVTTSEFEQMIRESVHTH